MSTTATAAQTIVAPYRDTKYLIELTGPTQYPVWRFVLLSVLLHVWLVLSFADASRPADRQAGVMWGKLNVALKKLTQPDSAEPPSQAPGLKLSTELGAASKPATARPAPRPPMVSPPAPAPAPPQEALPQAAARPQEPAVQPLMQRPVNFEAVPLQPLPAATATPVAPLPESTTRVDPPAAVPLAPIAVPRTQAPLTMPADTPSRFEAPAQAAPLTPLAPATARSVEVLPEATTRVEPPAAQPMRPMQPVQPAAPIAPLPEPASRVEVAPTQPLAPLTPTPTLTPPAPQAVESAVRVEPPTMQPLAPLAPPTAQRPISRLAEELPSRVEPPRAETLTPLAPPRTDRPINRMPEIGSENVPSPQVMPASPSGPPSRVNPDLPFGLPDATGTKPATPNDLRPTPRLDLDTLRQRAREIDSDANRKNSLFAGPKLPPKSKEQEIFDKALKEKDCKTAYADMGLLAVVPLVTSALSEDRKCKW